MAESKTDGECTGLYPDLSSLNEDDKYEPPYLVSPTDIPNYEHKWNFPTTSSDDTNGIEEIKTLPEDTKEELNNVDTKNKERRRNNRLQSGALNDKYSNAQRFPGGHGKANTDRPMPLDNVQNINYPKENNPEERLLGGGNPSNQGGRRPRNQCIHRETNDMIFFWREGSPFSQWHRAKFTIDGVEFNCAEQYMMYNKAKIAGNDGMADLILKEPDPDVQKSYGRRIPEFNPDVWMKHREEVVKKGNKAKFSQNEKLKEKLLATYPKLLVEASPIDPVWGIGLDAYADGVEYVENWRGENLLGNILTDVRDELLKEVGFL